MKMRTFATLSLLVLTSLAVSAAPREKSNLEAIDDKAFREFDAEHDDEALKALEQIDARQPDLAESPNRRGVVLMRQGKFDQAEKALRKASSLDPRERSIFATSKVTWRFMGGCGSCEGANRIGTTLEVGFNCNPLILKVDVSCIEAISKEKVNCISGCLPPARPKD